MSENRSTVWQALENVRAAADNGLEAEARVPATSGWYAGHFPGAPILPGIAQVSLALELAGRLRGEPPRLAALRRLRFRRVIQPGVDLTVRVTPVTGTPDAFNFSLRVGGATACSGMLVLRGNG
jgi:3-hydroxyacyl-[acyl-carrier-protein] dehydratase